MKYIVLFITLFSTPSYAWDNALTEFSSINIYMRNMWSGGSWEENNKSGYYRVLIVGGGYEHYKTRLLIQWVLHGSDMKKPIILKTTEIMELSEPLIYSFNLPKCIQDWKCNKMEINALHTYERTKHLFSIHLTGVGKYTIEHTSL